MEASGRLRTTALATAVMGFLICSPAMAQINQTFSSTTDFQSGSLLNLDPSSGQLQVSATTTPLPFLYVACSNRGTAVRIDIETGDVLGEYLTSPDGMARNPSRTTVDKFGNVWVSNRDEGGYDPSGAGDGYRGSVIRIGVVIGGTRGDRSGTGPYTFTPDPDGQYLQGPFTYNTVVDRDGDGLIKTSRGLNDVLSWANGGSVDSYGGVTTAEDECIINYTRIAGTCARTVAVDANNDLWTGGLCDLEHEKIDGVTGLPIAGTYFNEGCGGYGGLVDGNGVLWSARGGGGLLRFDPSILPAPGDGECLGNDDGDYGLGIDRATGHIWHTALFSNRVVEIDADGTTLNTYSHGNGEAQGVCVDDDGSVWVAHALFGATTVGHIKTDGTYVGNVALGSDGNGPTGVAVDANGKVWATCINSSTVKRIDPTAGSTGGGGYPIGAVDLTVDLNATTDFGDGPVGYAYGIPAAGPYNYSDMTGFVSVGATGSSGTWTKVVDGGMPNIDWEQILWNGSTPGGSNIIVEVRASNSTSGLPSETFTSVPNGGFFKGVGITGITAGTIIGQFLEVRVTLERGPGAAGASPTLFDITIRDLQDVRLPVELKSFDLTASNGKVFANWETASEVNNAGFELYRAKQTDTAFRLISSYQSNTALAGLGTSSFGKRYSYVDGSDGSLKSGITYRYRLVDVSSDGVRSVQTTKDVRINADDGSNTAFFKLYAPSPNPATDEVLCAFSIAEAGSVSIEVYGEDGKLVMAPMKNRSFAAGDHQQKVDLRELSAGSYSLRLTMGLSSRVQRFVVVR